MYITNTDLEMLCTLEGELRKKRGMGEYAEQLAELTGRLTEQRGVCRQRARKIMEKNRTKNANYGRKPYVNKKGKISYR